MYMCVQADWCESKCAGHKDPDFFSRINFDKGQQFLQCLQMMWHWELCRSNESMCRSNGSCGPDWRPLNCSPSHTLHDAHNGKRGLNCEFCNYGILEHNYKGPCIKLYCTFSVFKNLQHLYPSVTNM